MTGRMPPKGNPADEWILREDQLRTLVSSVRTDIVDQLAGRGEMSIKELATAIGKQPSALYHHLDKLVEVELVQESGTRVVNRKAEKLYRTPSRRMRLRGALETGEHGEIMDQIVASLTRQADRDFSRGQASLSAKADGDDRNLGFFRLVAKPNAERLSKINQHLDAIAELMWEEPEDRDQSIVLTWIMAPGS